MPFGLRRTTNAGLREIINRLREDPGRSGNREVIDSIGEQLGVSVAERGRFRSLIEDSVRLNSGHDKHVDALETWLIQTKGLPNSRLASLKVDTSLMADGLVTPPLLLKPSSLLSNYRLLRDLGKKPADLDLKLSRAKDVSDGPAKPTGLMAQVHEMVKGGVWSSYYDAITREDGKFSSANPELRAKAEEFFDSLPAVRPGTSVAELVEVGVMPKLPTGFERMVATARYIPGRQVMVKTNIEVDPLNPESFGRYREDGERGLTHRAVLVGHQDGHFLVKVDGREEPIEVPEDKIARLNQPQVFEGDKLRVNGVVIDYNDPYMKAKVYEGFSRLWDVFNELDFSKAYGEAKDGVTRVEGGGEVLRQQERGVRIIHDMIKMRYSHDLNSGDSAGRLAIKGSGQCYSQAAVMAGLLAPFARALGVDFQNLNGQVYRDADPAYPGYPYNGSNHGWLQVTYRPSGITKITDRTWMQGSIEMDKAYSYNGDRVPRSLMEVDGQSDAQPALRPADIDFESGLQIPTRQRLFGVKGVDGRNQHQP